MACRVSHTQEYMFHNKIQCIKGVRAVTGMGLREAKEAVEEIMNRGFIMLDLSMEGINILKHEYGFTVNSPMNVSIPNELFEFDENKRFFKTNGDVTATNNGDVIIDRDGNVVAFGMPSNSGIIFQSEDTTWKTITYSDFKLVREMLQVLE